ncbi:4-hydroxy-2-oxoheptanedioate aldolase [Pusillimonas sp. MFBS29]|uniref:4-hydroxy-2-oxoheptanedioate aldolase n=1 Tax=Pusillimonas sp. MFBS29 TaxID=2886690 RepID=UPI001D10DB01|nr:4-hydroxy-2-oxoheptanedioate aldolase [Pusillimonas sp. MFBS29]MCC2597201.1 4-hydroxy-2-oxoheptanedioate aldolase [Pusillimonas sp. MFBS29]
MQHPANSFKRALRNGEAQIGLWQGLASSYTAELCATVGYDWLLIDGEHAPNTIQTVLSQLQAVAAYPVAPVVRPAWNDPVELKRLLDIGAQNLLIPMVQNADEARAAVAAVRYPPEGVRGVGAALARASRWGGVSDYLARANDEICLLCQVETASALQELDGILAVEGVDGVFIGPADLAASMGHTGNPGHPDVKTAISDAIVRIRKAGKAAGILQGDIALAKQYLELGAQFVAVGVDAVLLRRAATDLLAQFKHNIESVPSQPGSAY